MLIITSYVQLFVLAKYIAEKAKQVQYDLISKIFKVISLPRPLTQSAVAHICLSGEQKMPLVARKCGFSGKPLGSYWEAMGERHREGYIAERK